MTVWGKKKEQIAGLIGSVFNTMNINSEKDAPSINAVKSYVPPKDNLLDNADFKSGAINQKSNNYEGITKSQYTIDRWILDPKGKDTSLYIQNGRVEIYQDGTGQDFDIRQFIYVLNSNEKYHLHFRYNDKDYDCDLIANENSYNVAINDDIEVLLSKKDSKYLLAINFRNQQSNFIEYIKLEKGSYFTGMPVWNETQELLKCQSRYIMIKSTNVSLSLNEIRIINTNSARLIFKTNSTINKAPMIKFSNIFVVQFNDGAYRQVSQVSSVNYSRGYILIDLRTIEETLNLNEPCYLFINTNGYLEIDMNDY